MFLDTINLKSKSFRWTITDHMLPVPEEICVCLC